MRYIDVGVTSRGGHEGKEQTGGGGQTASARWAAAARRQEPAGSGAHRRSPAANGVPLARGARRRWHRCAARDEPGRTTGAAGRGGIVAAICGVVRRCGGARFCDATMDAQAGAAVDRTRIRRAIQRGPCMAAARPIGLIQPEAGTARLGARPSGHRALAQAHLAGAKKTPVAKDD